MLKQLRKHHETGLTISRNVENGNITIGVGDDPSIMELSPSEAEFLGIIPTERMEYLARETIAKDSMYSVGNCLVEELRKQWYGKKDQPLSDSRFHPMKGVETEWRCLLQIPIKLCDFHNEPDRPKETHSKLYYTIEIGEEYFIKKVPAILSSVIEGRLSLVHYCELWLGHKLSLDIAKWVISNYTTVKNFEEKRGYGAQRTDFSDDGIGCLFTPVPKSDARGRSGTLIMRTKGRFSLSKSQPAYSPVFYEYRSSEFDVIVPPLTGDSTFFRQLRSLNIEHGEGDFSAMVSDICDKVIHTPVTYGHSLVGYEAYWSANDGHRPMPMIAPGLLNSR